MTDSETLSLLASECSGPPTAVETSPRQSPRRSMAARLRGALMLAALSPIIAPIHAQDLSRLEAEIGRLVDVPDGSVGVGLLHLESGREIYVNGDDAFLMGSTYKVPIAVHLLALVDAGRERLERLVPLRAGDLFPSGSLLSERFRDGNDPGVSISLQRYLELMLILSDNAATDVILHEVGGPPAVTTRMRSLGIDGLRVDRSVMEIYRDYIGLHTLPPREQRNLDTMLRLMAGVAPEEAAVAQHAFHAGERDRATPRGMISLLRKIWWREALSPERTALLLSVMDRVETGSNRISGLLPPGTRVDDKTGTFGTIVVNDVGFVYLPDGAGHLALAVFTEDRTLSAERKEQIIAHVARAAYDYFTLIGPNH